MTTTTEIPTNVSLPKAPTWRIANGKICRGSEKEKTLVEYQEQGKEPSLLVGIVTRFSIEEGEYNNKDGTTTPYHQLEVEFKTAEVESMRIALSLITQEGEYKPSGAACGLAWGLLHVEPGEPIALKTVQGQQKNSKGGYPTFVNFYKVLNQEGDTKPFPIRKRDDRKITYPEIFDEMLPKLKAHPLYKERPKKQYKDFYTVIPELKIVYDYCVEHGWPNPQNAEAEWLELMNLVCKKRIQQKGQAWPVKSLEDFPEDWWHEVRIKLFGPNGVAAMPAVLAKAKERLASESAQEDSFAEEDDIDPFAGE